MMLLDKKLSGLIIESMLHARQLPSEHWTQDSKHYNSDTYTSWWKYWTITVDFPSHFVTLRLALDGFDPWRQAGFKGWIVTALREQNRDLTAIF